VIVAVIPARAGSKGVPRKNVKLVAGHPLIAYSIMAARGTSSIDRVVVSTDSAEIAEVSRHYGAEVPFLRPAALAGDNSPDREFVVHAIDWFTQHDRVPELLVHLRPTTPLRDPALIDEAISLLLAQPEATSLRSAHEAPESPYKWFIRDAAGYFQPMLSTDGRSVIDLPRQLAPKVYIPDGYVDVLRTEVAVRSATIHGPNILAYISPRCVEVDTLEDLHHLEYRISRDGSPLLDVLNAHCAVGTLNREQQ
jgi:CMP-N,N'-diacetyllegionaminic acid synthase